MSNLKRIPALTKHNEADKARLTKTCLHALPYLKAIPALTKHIEANEAALTKICLPRFAKLLSDSIYIELIVYRANSISIELIVYRANLSFRAGIAFKFDKAWETSFRQLLLLWIL